jgi:DEAD/DEAH box helicase domain-containing protein
MDIGKVDAVISAFTNDYDKFVQRIGRAGRRGKKSYGISVFRPDGPISHYYSKYIDRYWNQKHNVEIQTSNPVIQNLHKEAEEGEWAGMDSASAFPFRDTAGDVETSLGGKRAIPIGYHKLHQNAIYRWNNGVYRSKGLKKIGKKIVADLEIASTNDNANKTSPIIEKNFFPQKELEPPKTRKSYSITFCLVKIEHEITGYKEGHKKAKFGDMVEGGPIEHWKWSSEHLAVKIKFSDLSASGEDPILHTIIHLLDNASKIITKAEANDVQGHALLSPGEFYLYDDTANGQSGYSKLIFDKFDRILEEAKELVKQDCCNEPGGCKKCTFTTSWCLTDNANLDKVGAKEFFNDLILN